MDKILQTLFIYQDKKYADFVKKLLPSSQKNTKIIGVRLPQLRLFAKEIVHGDWQKFLMQNTNIYFEQTMLEGFIIAYVSIPLEQKFYLITKFLPKINNWSICDSFCASFKLKTTAKKAYLPFIKSYLNSPNEYELRFAIVMLLDYYLTTDFADNTLQLIYQVKDISYSVKMAKAWAFSKYFAYYPEKGLYFLQNNSLTTEVLNMTCQKIRDSKRISNEFKQQLKNL